MLAFIFLSVDSSVPHFLSVNKKIPLNYAMLYLGVVGLASVEYPGTSASRNERVKV